MNRINFRQIILHFIGTWFFMFAFKTLFSLHETKMILIYRDVDPSLFINELEKQGVTSGDMVDFAFWTNVGETIGLLIGFLLSLYISLRANWFWVNSLIVLVLTYCLSWGGLLGLSFLGDIYYLKAWDSIHIKWLLIIIASIFLFFGVITFFNRESFRFISKSRETRESHYR